MIKALLQPQTFINETEYYEAVEGMFSPCLTTLETSRQHQTFIAYLIVCRLTLLKYYPHVRNLPIHRLITNSRVVKN